ncbi:hypothetical protein ACWDTP_34335 [Mycobacterium sp. NPDC003449]
MTWPARIGMGVAVLIALAVGQTVDSALPVEATDVRPFVHAGGIGDRIRLAYADVTADAVRTARTLDTPQGTVGTPGRWLVVDLTVVARGRPLHKPGVSLRDGKDRAFAIDPRSGYSWESAPTGVPWRVQVPFEMPEDGLAGATLVFTRNGLDDRRDDVARIDLGIGSDDVADLRATGATMEITPARMATS